MLALASNAPSYPSIFRVRNEGWWGFSNNNSIAFFTALRELGSSFARLFVNRRVGRRIILSRPVVQSKCPDRQCCESLSSGQLGHLLLLHVPPAATSRSRTTPENAEWRQEVPARSLYVITETKLSNYRKSGRLVPFPKSNAQLGHFTPLICIRARCSM